MQRQDDQWRRPLVDTSPSPLPCLRSLSGKARDFLSVFTGDGKPLPVEPLDYPLLAFPDRPLSGQAVAAAALYGHDQGDRKRLLKQLSFALTNIPRRGYLLNTDVERMSSRSWWRLTDRKQRLLLSMTPGVLAHLLRPTWILEALKENKRLDLDQLRRKGSFSGAMLSLLAGLAYEDNGNAAHDLSELVEMGVLQRHNLGFLPDQWPPDAEARPMPIDEILRAAKTSERFFSRPSKTRDQLLKDLGVPIPQLTWTRTLQCGVWVPGPEQRFAP